MSEVLHLSGLPVPVCRGIRLPILCCAFFLFSGTKVATHAAFVKGRFTLRVKNLLCSLRSCGIFYPSPLTNTLCFAGRCLGKKKKNVVLWRGVRFVILLPGFVRMVGDPPRSAGHAISFCHCRQLLFWVFRVYRYHFEILRYAKALKPPEKTPPEAIIESLCIVSTKCGNDTQITVLQ